MSEKKVDLKMGEFDSQQNENAIKAIATIANLQIQSQLVELLGECIKKNKEVSLTITFKPEKEAKTK